MAGAALPGEEAEGTVPRVLELAVRHPRLLLSLPAKHHESIRSNAKQTRAAQHGGNKMVAADERNEPRGERMGREGPGGVSFAHLWGAAARGMGGGVCGGGGT